MISRFITYRGASANRSSIWTHINSAKRRENFFPAMQSMHDLAIKNEINEEIEAAKVLRGDR